MCSLLLYLKHIEPAGQLEVLYLLFLYRLLLRRQPGTFAYCIEPGTGQRTGDTLTEKDENFFNNISPNGTISGDDIRLLIGRILQYGYRGGISTSWKSQNESDANCIAHAYATQILIWETIVGERDAGFNHVSTSGYNAVLECVSTAHPLRSKILSYYNSMVTSVQNHTKVPSFCTRSSGSAKVNELEWNGSKYVATLTDTNGVLGNYNSNVGLWTALAGLSALGIVGTAVVAYRKKKKEDNE